MRIRMKADMTGTVHGRDGGVRRGEIVDWLDDASAENMVELGLAEHVSGEEQALSEAGHVESALTKRPGSRRKKGAPDWSDDKARGWQNVESDISI